MKDPVRRRANRRGLAAETIAAWYLRFKGYGIAGRRMRTPVGEIDLIATTRTAVCFVEVKARASVELGIESVSRRQAARIVAAARVWLSQNPRYADRNCRFDVILITPRRLPRHLQNAFGEDLW